MVPLEYTIQQSTVSSPRISFSTEFLDENNFISICPNPQETHDHHDDQAPARSRPNNKELQRYSEFEFLSGSNDLSSHITMLTADELFFEGKLLPFNKIAIKTDHEDQIEEDEERVEEGVEEVTKANNNNREEDNKVNSWFVDDDPSPRPPNCTVLWKELLRLKTKKQRSRPVASLSPSSSSSSSSSSNSIGDHDHGHGSAAGTGKKEQNNSSYHNYYNNSSNNVTKRVIKKASLERTSSGGMIRIRPMIHVPICTQVRTSASSAAGLPPLFPVKRGRLERRESAN